MSKTLILKDGSTVEMTGGSDIYNVQTVVAKFADVDDLALLITEENLANAEIAGEKFENIVPASIRAESDINGNVEVTFFNRDKTVDELQNEQIGELQDIVGEILEVEFEDDDEPIDDGEDIPPVEVVEGEGSEGEEEPKDEEEGELETVEASEEEEEVEDSEGE